MRLKTMNDTVVQREAAGTDGNEDRRHGTSKLRGSRRQDVTVESLPGRLGDPGVGSQRSKPSPLTQGPKTFAKGIDTRSAVKSNFDCDAIAWVATGRGISSDLPAPNCRWGNEPTPLGRVYVRCGRRGRGVAEGMAGGDVMVVRRLAILSRTLPEVRPSWRPVFYPASRQAAWRIRINGLRR